MSVFCRLHSSQRDLDVILIGDSRPSLMSVAQSVYLGVQRAIRNSTFEVLIGDCQVLCSQCLRDDHEMVCEVVVISCFN